MQCSNIFNLLFKINQTSPIISYPSTYRSTVYAAYSNKMYFTQNMAQFTGLLWNTIFYFCQYLLIFIMYEICYQIILFTIITCFYHFLKHNQRIFLIIIFFTCIEYYILFRTLIKTMPINLQNRKMQ